jgi:hypothetical protein
MGEHGIGYLPVGVAKACVATGIRKEERNDVCVAGFRSCHERREAVLSSGVWVHSTFQQKANGVRVA